VLRIGVLALDGVELVGARSFADRLSQELGRLVAERGVPAALGQAGDREHLRAPAVPVLPAGLSAARLAAAVYDGLDADPSRTGALPALRTGQDGTQP
jgi:hypothetical protein